jgi:hypothetical protein
MIPDDEDDNKGFVRRSDPDTSEEAADSIERTRLENEAWAALLEDGRWLTYFQWSAISGIKYASLTPRGKSLWRRALVMREKRPGLNDKGKIVNLLHHKAIRPGEHKETDRVQDRGDDNATVGVLDGKGE